MEKEFLSKDRLISTIVPEVCKNNNLNLEIINEGWILRISRDKSISTIWGNYFDINKSAAVEICKDKSSTASLLNHYDIPAIEHLLVERPGQNSSEDINHIINQIDTYAKSYSYNVVCKPKDSAGGLDIYRALTRDDVISNCMKVFNKKYDCCISPYFKSEFEYRVYVLNRNVEITYQKIRPVIIGDGKSTIRNLFDNYLTQTGTTSLFLKDIFYSQSHINYDKILNKEEILRLTWQHNLSFGSTANLMIPSNIKDYISKSALKAGKVIGIDFFSIDFLESKEEGIKVIEVNPGIVLDLFVKQRGLQGYNMAYNLFEKAILLSLSESNIKIDPSI